MYSGAAPLVVTVVIPLLAVTMLALLVLAHRRHRLVAAAIAVGWFAAYGALAATGVLARFDARPPPMLLLLPLPLVVAVAWALSRDGASIARDVPMWALVASQGFRLPLELAMHRAATAGVMPVQMSFGGYNFDIVTGATALVLAPLVATGRATRALVLVWNVMGSLLLLAIVAIAMAASPMVHAFGPTALNTWVCYVPFVWLPSVLVAVAGAGHVLVFRALKRTVQ